MSSLRTALVALGIPALTLPVAFVATFLSMPLWSAIESSTGIESVGHSGPAEWCFVAMWALATCTAFAIVVAVRRTRSRGVGTIAAGTIAPDANEARESSRAR